MIGGWENEAWSWKGKGRCYETFKVSIEKQALLQSGHSKKWVISQHAHAYTSIFTNPSAWAGGDTISIFR